MKNKFAVFFFLIVGLAFTSPTLSASYLMPFETPIVKYLEPIQTSELDSGILPIQSIYVINLDARPEKWARMQSILEEKGLLVNRVSAINGWKITQEIKEELAGPYPLQIFGGAIGCLLSHVSVLQDAFDKGFQMIWVMEDDVDFLGDEKLIPELVERLTAFDPDWDIFYTDTNCRNDHGGYFMQYTWGISVRPDQSSLPASYLNRRTLVADGIMRVRNRYGTTSMVISRKGIEKALNYFTHTYLWGPIDHELHLVPRMREYSATEDIATNQRHDAISDTKPWSNLNE